MTIHVDDVSAISGLKFRQFQGPNDFAPIAEVLTASEMADHLDRHVDADDIAHAFQHMSNCDPYHDVIIAEVNGSMVGYVRGWWEDGVSPERWYSHNGFLIPAWRRKGIGHSLLYAVERRLREIADDHPVQLEKLFQVSVSQFKPGTGVMLERSEYQPVRYYYLMVRPTLDEIMEFPLPAGLEVRAVIPDHYPAIWKAVKGTNRDEWGHKELTEDDYEEWLSSSGFQPDLWQIAWDTKTDQVAGMVLTFINHAENKQLGLKRGYTEGIGVVRVWRRRGVARALISNSLLAQKAVGMTESALVADSDSTSNVVQLYESCGFRITKRDTLYRKPLKT